MQQGGTEVLVQALLRGLSQYYEIVLISGDRSLAELPSEYARLACGHVSWGVQPFTQQSASALAQSLVEHGVQLAHFHFGGTFTWQSNRFWRCPVYYLGERGVPCLTTNHLATEWLNCGVNPARPRWQKHLYQLFAIFSRSLLYHRLRCEVCVSKHDLRRVSRMFPFFRHKLLQRYHSLLPADAPPPALSGRLPVILCVGTIGGRKAQPILAEAFCRIAARYQAWSLEFIGRTDDTSSVAQILRSAAAAGASGRVLVRGRLEDEETAKRMQAVSIFAMPSLQEGLGLALQEALFHGCVGVGTRAGGIPELIDDGSNGLLVPAGDVTALSAALERLMANPALLERFRQQSRPSIVCKKMTAPAMIDEYRRLYETCR